MWSTSQDQSSSWWFLKPSSESPLKSSFEACEAVAPGLCNGVFACHGWRQSQKRAGNGNKSCGRSLVVPSSPREVRFKPRRQGACKKLYNVENFSIVKGIFPDPVERSIRGGALSKATLRPLICFHVLNLEALHPLPSNQLLARLSPE